MHFQNLFCIYNYISKKLEKERSNKKGHQL